MKNEITKGEFVPSISLRTVLFESNLTNEILQEADGHIAHNKYSPDSFEEDLQGRQVFYCDQRLRHSETCHEFNRLDLCIMKKIYSFDICNFFAGVNFFD